jgi:uncharacterized membrane-anchored protein YitT (DUF2179 family)
MSSRPLASTESAVPAGASADTAISAPADDLQRHRPMEDAMALLTATLFMALGLVLFQKVGLLAGGTAGLAFLIHYATGWPFGAAFFAVNLPFVWLAWTFKGREFTLKTGAAVALISVLSSVTPQWIALEHVNPFYAAITGGCLMGTGLLMLFRHRASLGGVGVLALLLQERKGWRAGKFQMAVDVAIVVAALAITDVWRVALSVIGAVAVNLLLATNHKPGRYLGM